MYDLPSQENMEIIIDASAAKGNSQPILVHAKVMLNLSQIRQQRLNNNKL